MGLIDSTMAAYFPDRHGGMATTRTLSGSTFLQPFTVEAWMNVEVQHDLAGLVDASDYGEEDFGWFLGTIHNRVAFGVATEYIFMQKTTRTVKSGFTTIQIPVVQQVQRREFKILYSDRTFAVNRWHHIAAIYSIGGLTMYLDGHLVGTLGLPPGTLRTKDGPLLMGAMWRNGSDSMQGSLAEVRVWRGVRSLLDIQQNMSLRLTGEEPGLLAYFPLDEGTDVITWDYAQAQSAESARLAGSTTWRQTNSLPLYSQGQRLSPNPEAEYNPVLDFDGQQDHVHIEAPLPGIRSFSAWVRPASPKDGTIIAYTGADTQILLQHRADGRLTYREGEQTLLSNRSLTRNTWTHITLSIDGPERRWIINGLPDSLSNTFGEVPAVTDLYFGAAPVNGSMGAGFRGQIDTVSVWDIPRDTFAVQATMGHRMNGNEPGLIGYWSFDEAGGSLVHDLSAGRRSGAANGTAWVNAVDLLLKKARASAPDDPPPDTTEPEVAPDAFLSSDHPVAILYRRLRDAIEDGNLKIDGELIDDFVEIGYLENILPVFIEIRNAKVEVVEVDPGTIGVPGQDLDSEGKFVSPEKTRVVVSGTTKHYLNAESVDVKASFFTGKGRPQAAFQFSLTPEQADATPRWGLGDLFPDIPLIRAMNIKGPTIVLTTASVLYNPDFDAGVNEGFNFYGNIDLQNTGDKILDGIGSLYRIKEIAIHAALSTGKDGTLLYLIELAYHRDLTLFSVMREQENGEDAEIFRLSLGRSDFAVEIKGMPPEPTIKVSNDLVVKFKDLEQYTYLIWTGGMALEAESISPFFTLNGTGRNAQGKLTGNEPNTTVWREPFGIPGVEIRQASLQMGLTYAAPWLDNFGIMGNLKIGDIDGSMAMLIDTNDPDNFVLACEAERLTLLQILSSMSPVTFLAYQALPRGLVNALNHFVDVYVEEPKIYIVPLPTSIGGVHYRDAGVTISGTLYVWGWRAALEVIVDYANGITAHATMDPINILDGAFQITGAKGDKNPLLDMELSTSDQYAHISARVVLLALSRELFLEASESGLTFELTQNIEGLLDSSLICKFADGTLAANGSIDFNLNLNTGPIRIEGVTVADNVRLVDVSLDTTAALMITDTPSFLFTLRGSFEFYGQRLTIPEVVLHVPPEDFEKLHAFISEYIIDKAEAIFSEIFNNALEWAKSVADGIVEFTGSAAAVLKDAFDATIEDAAKIAKLLESDANALARDLENAYGRGMQDVAKALKEAGYTADQVAGALKSTYNRGAEEVAKALREAGYTAAEVGGALRSAYNASVQVITQAMKQAGYQMEQIGQVLHVHFRISAEQIAHELKEAEYAVTQISDYLSKSLRKNMDQVASLLRRASFSSEQIASALKSSFSASADQVAGALQRTGLGIEQVWNSLKSAFRLSTDSIAKILGSAGYTAGEISRFLSGSLNQTVESTARILKNAGFSAQEVGDSIKNTYRVTADRAAQILKSAGYGISDIGKTLNSVFGRNATDVARSLKNAQFTARQIAGILGPDFKLNKDDAAKVLKDAGFGINDIGSAIKAVYNLNATQIASALRYAGYSVKSVGNWLKDIGGYGDKAIESALKNAGYAAGEVKKFMKDVFDWFKGLF